MDNTEIKEKELRPANGILMLILNIVGVLLSFVLMIAGPILLAGRSAALGVLMLVGGILLMSFFSILFAGLKAVRPNEALVLTLFGSYYGTISRPGFFFVHPFSATVNPAYEAARAEAVQKATAGEQKKSGTGRPMPRKAVSTKTMTLLNGTQKVNDVLGNPIIIGAVVLWKVSNPTHAVFQVENYAEYLSTQTDSTIRNIARLYPYDNMDADNNGEVEKTLRGSAQEIAGKMQAELQERVAGAGLRIVDVRITHLSYAEEIAAAMLQRQQADAIIAARQKIVDGAVGMVKMAIEKLGEEEIVMLDEERKAAMVSNLLVVLCGNKDAQPVVNSGSLY
jgi:regulator of protease activity HflC (stomatin/prohibitin superfamily)